MNDKDIIQEAQEAFKIADEASSENRAQALDDLRFARLGEQWPDAIRKQRQLDGRPCLTINRMPSFIRQVVNDARQNKPGIKVRPADSGADIDTADIMSGLIRNIEQQSSADVAYDTAIDFAASCGIGYFRVNTQYAHDDSFDLDIVIDRVANPLTIYGDPSSTAADSSDWNLAFVTDMLSDKEFERRYKGAEKSDWRGDYDDMDQQWRTENNVRIAEYWTREEVARKILKMSDGQVLDEKAYLENQALYEALGLSVTADRMSKTYKVTQRLLSGAEILETNDWPGIYIPIIPVYGEEVIVEGKRHFISLTRQARDAQMMFNFWRTASTELVALAPKAPYLGPVGAFATDEQKWSSANTSSHPYIEYDGPVSPQRQGFAGPPAGALQEALNAADDMKSIMGIHDASLGARSNETSGKAILARQREGDVSTFHFIDNLSRGIRHGGRILIDLIPKIISPDRMVRIIGVDGTPENVQLGKNADPNAPKAQRIYDLTAGKYDLVVDTGPSFTTRREEAAQSMIEMIRADGNMAPIIGDLMAKNMDWPEADEVARRLKIMLPPQIQEAESREGMPPEAQAMIAQAEQAVKQLQGQMQQGMQAYQQLQQELEKAQMQAANKQVDAAAKVESERIKAEADIKVAEINAASEQMVAKIEGLMQQLQGQIANMPQPVASPATNIVMDPQGSLSQIIAQGQAQALAVANAPRRKTLQIQAPSGAVYTGVIDEVSAEPLQ